MWDGVFDEARPGVLSQADDIARAEAELGFRMPPSFRSFAETFGAGSIGGHLRLFTPLPIPEADLVARAHLISHAIATAIDGLAQTAGADDEPHRFTVEGDADAALMERACFFGQTEAGAFVFFDVVPEAETVATRGEYEIWVLGPDLETVHYGGPDLVAFVRGLTGDESGHILGAGVEPLPAVFVGDDATALADLSGPQA